VGENTVADIITEDFVGARTVRSCKGSRRLQCEHLEVRSSGGSRCRRSGFIGTIRSARAIAYRHIAS
jgi:hypothetical protein